MTNAMRENISAGQSNDANININNQTNVDKSQHFHKNVEAEYNPQYQGYNWKVRANDESVINYGERDYEKGHRLLTAHSKTERAERSQPHRQIKRPRFSQLCR